jgi:hypothetical protein
LLDSPVNKTAAAAEEEELEDGLLYIEEGFAFGPLETSTNAKSPIRAECAE